MNFGKIFGSISPAYGMASGHGAFGNGGLMGTLSPLLGMAIGKGLFGGHGHDGSDQQQPQVMPQPMPGQMQAQPSPMQPVQSGPAQPPTSFGQPTGMFGAGPDPRQAMMQKYRQWQMINGGGY